MKLIIEQTIIICIYLFSVFLNISNVYFVIENDTTSASCNFPAKFLLIPRNTCTSYFASALCLDCIYMVGRVWSMISHLSDINVVFDKRFRQKESKLKKWIAFEWETTFQINLYWNDDQPGSILCGIKCVCIYSPPPQCIVGSPDRANISGMFQIYLIPILKLLYFSCKNYAEKQRDRQQQIHTIQGQVTTLQLAFTYDRKSFA